MKTQSHRPRPGRDPVGPLRCLMILAVAITVTALASAAVEPKWHHLSSKAGDIPVPNDGTEQTSSIVLDIDMDGTNDFVITERTKAPSVVWYRRNPSGWSRHVVESQPLHIEAGSCFLDVDGDGDLDIVCGGDWATNGVWWWENPFPNFDPATPWNRHVIKHTGAPKHHDQIAGDFDGDGRDDVVFWNQDAHKLLVATVPPNPRLADHWDCTEIYSYATDGEVRQRGTYPGFKGVNEHEGLAKADIDGDGRLDIVAGGRWFRNLGGLRFETNIIDASYAFSRCAAGQLIQGGRPEVVLVVGDGIAPLIMYEWRNNAWVPKILLDSVDGGHSTAILDADGDGNLDIFCAEMRLNGANPESRCRILYGDGKGNFRTTTITTGIDFHESKMADLDGNGTMDILCKPYGFDTPRLDIFLNEGTAPENQFAGASFRGPLGLELYSLRQILGTNVSTGLMLAKTMGFNEVELPEFYNQTPLTLRALLDQNALRCTSLVAPYERLRDDTLGIVRDASILGAKYVVCGWLPHVGEFTRANAEHAVADFNRFGKTLREHGLTFCYHIHGYEFQPSPEGTSFDLMAAKSDADAVLFEADVFWIAQGGMDPVKLLEKYPGRFPLVHLKDVRKGTPTGVHTGAAIDGASVPIGSGQLDFTAILKTCSRVGVRRYFLEDEAPDATAQIPVSLEFLRTFHDR